jgi:hypothetical protein
MSRSGLEGSRIEEFCSRVYIECMALDVTMRLCPEYLRVFCLRQFGEAFAEPNRSFCGVVAAFFSLEAHSVTLSHLQSQCSPLIDAGHLGSLL